MEAIGEGLGLAVASQAIPSRFSLDLLCVQLMQRARNARAVLSRESPIIGGH